MSGNGAVIIFEQSGGIAGIQETWRIYGDGRVVKEDRHGQTAPAERIPAEAVRDAIERIVGGGFLDLADEYLPADRCCDRFTYRLTVVYDGTEKTVTTMDGAERPPALTEALEVVNQLIGQATPGQ